MDEPLKPVRFRNMNTCSLSSELKINETMSQAHENGLQKMVKNYILNAERKNNANPTHLLFIISSECHEAKVFIKSGH